VVKIKATKRLTAAARKEQIVEVTLRVVAKYGIQGTTMTRIAAAAGVSPAALYSHFKNRRQILLAALDVVYDRIFDMYHSTEQPDALQRIREIWNFHSSLLSSQSDGFVFPLFEFFAAPPNSGLRKAVGARQMSAVRTLAKIIDEAKEQGTVMQAVDSEEAAWAMIGIALNEDIASLIGLEELRRDGRSVRILEMILQVISTPSGDGHHK
jgi:AcrR family transcriptional regulator